MSEELGEAVKEVVVVFMIGRGRVITCSLICYGTCLDPIWSSLPKRATEMKEMLVTRRKILRKMRRLSRLMVDCAS